LATAEAPLGGGRRPWPLSLAGRLSLVTAAVLALALGVVSAVRTVVLRERLYQSTALQLDLDYRTLVTDLAVDPLQFALEPNFYASGLAGPNVGVLIASPAGQVLTAVAPTAPAYRSLLPPVLPARDYVLAFAGGPQGFRVAGSADRRQLVVLEPKYFRDGAPMAVFELASPVALINDTLRQQLEFDVLAGLVALVAASGAIYFLLGRFLAPLADMARASHEIARGHLDVALPAPRGDDEVSSLSRAFNHMIGRIQVALERERAEQRRVRAFLADASHSLRTPLTVLNGRLDLLLRGESREGPALEAALRDLRVEGERMARIVRGLLLLARLDEESEQPAGRVDVGAVLADLRGRLESLVGERHLVLDAPPGLYAWASVEALETIVTNLVENAARHTPEGGSIEVRVDASDGRVRLRVLDTGTGIAPGDLPRLFDRFYRGSSGAHRRDGGAGLGLSIVQRWTQALGGEVAAANREDRRGAVFTVWLRQDRPPGPSRQAAFAPFDGAP
jgi:two-component system sensor histidine kinase BaeS